MTRQHDAPSGTAATSEGAASSAAPGKRTLTGELAAGASPSGDGAGGLPFLDAMLRSQAIQHRADDFGATLGVPRVPVATDPASIGRVRAAGQPAMVSRGAAIFDPEAVDPATSEGAAVIAHEVVHVAQLGVMSGTGDGNPDAHEAEAEELSTGLLGGVTVAPPRMPLAAGVDAGYKGAKDAAEKKKKAEKTLPDKVDFAWTSSTEVLARKSWMLTDPSYDDAAAESVAPLLLKEMLREARAKNIYYWLTDERIEKASKQIVIRSSKKAREADGEFTEISFAASTLAAIGLPPDVEIMWKRSGPAGAQLLIDKGMAAKATFTTEDGARVFEDKAFNERIWSACEAWTGMTIPPQARAFLIDRWFHRYPKKAFDLSAALHFVYDAGDMEAIFGEAEWKAWATGEDEKAKKAGVTGSGMTFSGGGKPKTFGSEVSEQDKEFFRTFVAELGPKAAVEPDQQTEYGDVISQALIDLMREIDAHPRKAEILAALRSATGASKGLSWQELRNVINDVEFEANYVALTGKPPPAGGSKTLVDRPIQGRILEQSGKLFVGETARFAFDVINTLTAEELYLIIETPRMTVTWFAHEKGHPDKKVKLGIPGILEQDSATLSYNQFDPEHFEIRFPKAGEYEVHAFVNHVFYRSSYFSDTVVVRQMEEVMADLRDESFEGMQDPDGAVVEDERDFSGFMELPGAAQYHKGKRFRGTLPDDFASLSIEERTAFFAEERQRVDLFVADYTGSNKDDIRKWAKKYKKQLEAEEKALLEEVKGKDEGGGGMHPFTVRATYLSRKPGVNDENLNIIGTAGESPLGGVVVKLHDYSRSLDRKGLTFTGVGATFDQALEDAFVDFCKAYPQGRLAMMAETLDDKASFAKTGATLGFELDTHSQWEEIAGEMFDGNVQMAVNVIGTILMILFPAAATFIFAALVAYNAAAEVNHLVDLDNKGILTTEDVALSLASVALDLLPFLGKLKFVTKASKHAWLGLELLEGIGQAVLITVQARDALEEFHSNDVRELARLHERINALKATNPSSPDLSALQKSYDDLLAASKTRGTEMFKQFAVQGAIMFTAPAVFTKLTAGGTRATIHGLEKEGVLVRDPKVEHPHYDPETERIVIGKETPPDDVLAFLQDAWMRDTNSKNARIAMLLDSEQVEVNRVKGGGSAKVRKDGDKYIVDVPEGRKFDDVLDDVWKHRKAELGPGAVRPELPNLAPTFDVGDVLTKHNVIVGNPIAEQADAHDLMRKMAAGDKSAFDALGIERPEKFDPRSVEWGLGRLPSDGSFVIIRGEPGAVDWSKVPGVEPIAHSHPFGDLKKLKNTDGGIAVKELVSGKAGHANRVNVLPSASDFRFAAEHDLLRHVVHTPYIHVGGKKIANPGGKKGATIDVVIARPERVGDFAGNPEIGVYKADIAIRAGDEVLWSGTVYAARHPSVGDIVELDVPAGTVKRSAAGSGTPTGTGAGGDPHVRPDTDPDVDPVVPPVKPDADPDVAAATHADDAARDWSALLDDNRPYKGKFSKDVFEARYAEGWRYDLDKRKWYDASGQKRKKPKTFGEHDTGKDIFKKLTKSDSLSSFKPYAEMLQREGLIAGDDEIIKILDELREISRDEDFIRHEFKERFRERVMDRMVNPDPDEMLRRHPDLFPDGKPGAVPLEAKHREMRRHLKGLNSKDMGNLAEAWYRRVHAPDSQPQIAIKQAEMAKQGIVIDANRDLDLLDERTIRELKTVTHKLGKRDLEQFDDLMKLKGAEVHARGKDFVLDQVRVVFTLHEGGVKNLDWARTQLKTHEGRLTIEFFNAQGQSRIIDSADDLDATFRAWLDGAT